MKPRQKGQKWEISYRCPGYSKPIYERFPSYEAAKLRIAEIEYEKSIGQLRPPQVSVPGDSSASKKFITVGGTPGRVRSALRPSPLGRLLPLL